jgi:hypothetical protein
MYLCSRYKLAKDWSGRLLEVIDYESERTCAIAEVE